MALSAQVALPAAWDRPPALSLGRVLFDLLSGEHRPPGSQLPRADGASSQGSALLHPQQSPGRAAHPSLPRAAPSGSGSASVIPQRVLSGGPWLHRLSLISLHLHGDMRATSRHVQPCAAAFRPSTERQPRSRQGPAGWTPCTAALALLVRELLSAPQTRVREPRRAQYATLPLPVLSLQVPVPYQAIPS